MPRLATQPLPKVSRIFRGAEISHRRTRCAPCANLITTAWLVKGAERGRIAPQSDRAQERRAKTRKRVGKILIFRIGSTRDSTFAISDPIKGLTLSVLASKLDILIPYTVDIRHGRRVPHPRHWANPRAAYWCFVGSDRIAVEHSVCQNRSHEIRLQHDSTIFATTPHEVQG